MKRWTSREIRELQTGGNAIRQAVATGRSPRAVQEKAKRLGIQPPRMPHARYWPTPTRRRAMNLRRRGLSVQTISTMLGVPFGTVRRWVYQREVNMHPNDKLYALERAVKLAEEMCEERKVIDDLKQLRDRALREARGEAKGDD